MVGGPLGAALGGWHGAILAGALDECGKALAEECAEKFGNQTAKKMFGADSGSLANELKELSNDLEQVYRTIHELRFDWWSRLGRRCGGRTCEACADGERVRAVRVRLRPGPAV